MRSAEIFSRLSERGFRVRETDRGTFLVQPLSQLDDEIRDLLRALKLALGAERKEQTRPSSFREHLDRGGSFDDWEPGRSADDHAFVARSSIDPDAAERTECLACGWLSGFHGRAPMSTWWFVGDADAVAVIHAKAVVASAVAEASI